MAHMSSIRPLTGMFCFIFIRVQKRTGATPPSIRPLTGMFCFISYPCKCACCLAPSATFRLKTVFRSLLCASSIKIASKPCCGAPRRKLCFFTRKSRPPLPRNLSGFRKNRFHSLPLADKFLCNHSRSLAK